VQSVTLLVGESAGNSSAAFPLTSSHTGDVIAAGKPLTESQPSRVRCVALGGYPPPRLEVRLDPRRDVTQMTVGAPHYHNHIVHSPIHCVPPTKRSPFYFSNNSVKNEPISIIFGVFNPEKIRHEHLTDYC